MRKRKSRGSILSQFVATQRRHEAARPRAHFDWKGEIGAALETLQRPGVKADEDLLAACGVALEYGLGGAADAVLDSLAPRSARARELQAHLRRMRQLGLAPREATPPDSPRIIDELTGLIDRRVAGAGTLVIVFGGIRHGFFVTFDLLHNALRKTGASVIYVRDFERAFYLSGIVGIGDTVVATVAGLRRMADESGAKRVLTMGTCMGCSGALRYGLLLGAEAVLAIAPRSRLPAGKTIARTGVSTDAIRAREPQLSRDPRVLYDEVPSHPRITAIYGAHADEDAADADDLADIPGTTLVALDDDEHSSVSLLMANALFTPMLQQFVAHGALDDDLLARIRALPKPQPASETA